MTVIANPQSYACVFVDDFSFDLCRLGVPECIRHRLSPDVIGLFA
jgi:hypothetical protein